MKSSSSIQRPPDPIMHFVWAGGKKPLPDPNLKIIKKWAELNPHAQIWLWIDTDFFKVHYQNLFRDNGIINYQLHDIVELSDQPLHPLIRYEIDKLRPNYGASSDMIRYTVLYKYGGSAYFDSDVFPEEVSIHAFSNWMRAQRHQENDVLFVYTNSQGYNVIGNDVFYTRKSGNIALLDIINKIYDINYNRSFFSSIADDSFPISIFELAYYYNHDIIFDNNNEDMKANTTFHLTGPRCVRSILADKNELEKLNPQRKDLEKFPSKFIKATNTNHANWIGCNENWLKSVNGNHYLLDDILAKCKSALQFEITHWGVFCVDDYHRDGLILLENDPNFSHAYLAICLELYENNKDKIEVVKVTFAYKETRDWLKSHKIPLVKYTEKFPLEYHIQFLNFLFFQNSPSSTFFYLNEFIVQFKEAKLDYPSYKWEILIEKAYNYYSESRKDNVSCCTELLSEFSVKRNIYEAPIPTLDAARPSSRPNG